jgi:hypothetical protein
MRVHVEEWTPTRHSTRDDWLNEIWRSNNSRSGRRRANVSRPTGGDDPVLEEQRAQLIDDRRALVHQPPTDVQRLELELLGCLEGDEPHAGAARGLWDRVSQEVAEYEVSTNGRFWCPPRGRRRQTIPLATFEESYLIGCPI